MIIVAGFAFSSTPAHLKTSRKRAMLTCLRAERMNFQSRPRAQTSAVAIVLHHTQMPSVAVTTFDSCVRNGKSLVDPELVVEIERITGVSRHDLRPDLSRIFG